MKRYAVFLIAAFIFFGCKKEHESPIPCNGVAGNLNTSFGVDRTFDIVDGKHYGWLWISNPEGRVVIDSELVAAEEFILPYESSCEEELDVTLANVPIEPSSENNQIFFLNLDTYTTIEGGIRSTQSSDESYTIKGGGRPITIVNAPDDVESVIFPHKYGIIEPVINDESDTITFKYYNTLIYVGPTVVIKVKRESESFYRAGFFQVEGIAPLEVDYAELEHICETREIILPYESNWDINVSALIDGDKEQPIFLSSTDTGGQPASSIEVILPIVDNVSPYRLVANGKKTVAAEPLVSYQFVEESLPESLPELTNTLEFDVQGTTIDFSGGQEWSYIKALWKFRYSHLGQDITINWAVHLDSNQYEEYTLPEFPDGLLQEFPFLENLEEREVDFQMYAYRYEDGTTYREIKGPLWQNQVQEHWWLDKKGEIICSWVVD